MHMNINELHCLGSVLVLADAITLNTWYVLEVLVASGIGTAKQNQSHPTDSKAYQCW